jgi:uncharacterized protein
MTRIISFSLLLLTSAVASCQDLSAQLTCSVNESYINVNYLVIWSGTQLQDLVFTNNNDSAILYYGNWVLSLNAPGFLQNDYKASNTQFNRCLFTFRGPSVRWVGSKNNNHGLADVYIDDVFQQTVDSYNSTLIINAPLFEKDSLSTDKLHTLMIVIKKEKNKNSIGCYQDVDYFESSQPVIYVKEITTTMNTEYARIQNNTKPYAIPSTWSPVSNAADAPENGVSLQPGVVNDVFNRNINYLNHCFSSPTYCDGTGWSEWLPASIEGRMLSGAANTLRWGERSDMRNIIEVIINKIKNRVRADGYHNYYPEIESFALNSTGNSERKNYDRVFWTRGMLDAGRSGNSSAYSIVRNFYNWFDASSYLPNMLLGSNATNGLPGGGLVYHSPAGSNNDLVITEKYLDQDYWIDELTNRQSLCISDYPGINPHCYELLGLEAFLDEYVATGNQKYIDAVKGGWEIYNQNFEHVGGTTAICEGSYFPPKSFYLNSHTGETCGSVFWTNINSRLMHLYPNEEKYASEIEKSIYNVIMAAQDTNGYIRYHNNLHGRKDKPVCSGVCCEVSSVSMISKLPEYIYSIADDGLYVNLFVASAITWNQAGSKMTLTASTSFPNDPDVTLTLATAWKKLMNLRIRIPSWAANDMAIRVNGKFVAIGIPGSYVSINRKWSNNDNISFTLPMTFTTIKYSGLDQVNGNMDRYALIYGPLLMALQGPLNGPENVPQIVIKPADLPGLLTTIQNNPLQFNIKDYPSYKYVPYWQASGAFTCFPIIKP